jgi:hypothetical protein
LDQLVTPPEFGWAYAYQKPVDCLRIWKAEEDYDLKFHKLCTVKALYGRTAARVYWDPEDKHPEFEVIEQPRNLFLGYSLRMPDSEPIAQMLKDCAADNVNWFNASRAFCYSKRRMEINYYLVR